MKTEEIRGLVLQALKQGGWNQIEGLFSQVGKLKGRYEGRDVTRADGRGFLERGDRIKILEFIWGLVTQRVLVPGLDDNNLNLPFIRLTDYGKRCLEEERLLPHDPDGFLAEFNREVPTADPVIVDYLTESLQCFLHGLNRAAATQLLTYKML